MINRSTAARRPRFLQVAAVAGVAALACYGVSAASAASTARPAHTHAHALVWIKPNRAGGLDCNGMSPVQRLAQAAKACTDIRGMYGIHNKNTWDGRFYDNGRYIGHDEPDLRFLSANKVIQRNNITWNETLGTDPAAAPTVSKPGHDVNHWLELTSAPWFSMALCNQFSYPLLPCQPNSDANAPASSNAPVPPGQFPGGGSSFLEMQFYPPGAAPFVDNISCNNKFWCASLHINDLECTTNFASCNNNCEEPTNFAFIQTNGVPTGPPSPQKANLATNTPNKNTLMDEARRSPGDPHLGRTRAGGQRPKSPGDVDTRRHLGPERVHAGIGRQRLHGDQHQRLQRHPVQLRARVQHLRREQHRAVGGGPGGRQHPDGNRSLRGLLKGHPAA